MVSRTLLTAVIAALASVPVAAQPLETAVKAAFLPKFAPYVSWPTLALPAPTTAIALCVVGSDPFGSMIDEAAAGLKIEEHAVVVRRVSSIDAARDCHIAWLSGPRVAPMLAGLRGSPVLTVTDARTGPDHGIVHFVVQGGRVRFMIDDRLAADAGLTISAKLLNLAVKVTTRGRP